MKLAVHQYIHPEFTPFVVSVNIHEGPLHCNGVINNLLVRLSHSIQKCVLYDSSKGMGCGARSCSHKFLVWEMAENYAIFNHTHFIDFHHLLKAACHMYALTQPAMVTVYGVKDLGQYWFRLWPFIISHYATIWTTNIDSFRYSVKSPLWWLREHTLRLIISIKSEPWIIIHYLGLGHETIVCAVCLS